MKRLLLLTVLVVAAAASPFALAAAGAPAPSRLMTFIDLDSGLALRLQVEPGARDAGAFVLRVPGRGLYEGTLGSDMRVHAPTSITLDYEGPASLGAHVTAERSDGPATPAPVVIGLRGQIDPAARTAQVTLTDRGERFHLNTRNDHGRAALRAALERFEAALVAADWSALYALMNRGIRAAYTEATFAQQGAAEVARVGPVVAVRRGAVGREQRDDDGAVFVVVRYEVDHRAPSGATVSTTPYLAYFIPEGGSWRLWYSEER